MILSLKSKSERLTNGKDGENENSERRVQNEL